MDKEKLPNEKGQRNQYAGKVIRKKLTAKEQAFVKDYVVTKNGTQSALKVYDTTSPHTASVIASENLTKVRIRSEVERLMSQNDVEISDVLRVHKRNMLQDINLPTSQKAVSDFYEILGMKAQDKPSNDVKISFNIEK